MRKDHGIKTATTASNIQENQQ